MPTIQIELTGEVADALAQQARALLLPRRVYVRALLAAVAQEARRSERKPGAEVNDGER